MASQHHVEAIGALFSPRDQERLAKLLDDRAAQGWELRHIFQVQAPGGCLAFGKTVTTNLAVFRRAG
jgi:hypothetical protein